MKRYHFRGKWKNGDPIVICSYGKDKKDAWFNLLKAIKNKQFDFKDGDGFHMTQVTNEEIYLQLRKKGCSKTEANWLSMYGHTCYIVSDGKVYIN